MKNTNFSLVCFLVVAVISITSCGTVREVRAPDAIAKDGRPVVDKSDAAIAYSVGVHIDAPPDRVMHVLTRASEYARWNTTVKQLDGDIAAGKTIALVSNVAPDRTFNLRVSELSTSRMVWEDSMPLGLFSGVRTFALAPKDAGTDFTMSEVLSGGMLGMMESSLPDFAPAFAAFAADLKKRSEEPAGK